MICFRTLIFWYLWQQAWSSRHRSQCCDLLSYFDILIFMTTKLEVSAGRIRLWFAFVLWYSDIYDNGSWRSRQTNLVVICFRTLIFWYLWQLKGRSKGTVKVVICFRTLIFWYLWQPRSQRQQAADSCDLLSYFDILIFMTTRSLAKSLHW